MPPLAPLRPVNQHRAHFEAGEFTDDGKHQSGAELAPCQDAGAARLLPARTRRGRGTPRLPPPGWLHLLLFSIRFTANSFDHLLSFDFLIFF